MRSRRVSDLTALLDPQARAWKAVGEERVKLMPTPLGLQPTPYLRAAWSDRPFGRVAALEVASAHDGQRLAMRLRWPNAHKSLRGGEAFGDAAALALPVRGDPVLATMGSANAPIQLLHWMAGRDEVSSLVAQGLGSTAPGPAVDARAAAVWNEGLWSVVVSRSLAAPEGAAVLVAGQPTSVGFAVWEGANQERAGIKAFSIDWQELALDP